MLKKTSKDHLQKSLCNPLSMLEKPAPFEDYTKQAFFKRLTQIQSNAWGGVTLGKVQLDPLTEMMGVVLPSDTMLTMHTTGTIALEISYDGRHQILHPCRGGLTLVPSQLPITSRWNAPVQHFYCLLPQQLWPQLAAEYTNRDPTKLTVAPAVDFRDPLSENILLALQQELESNNAGGRLYVESLVQTLILHTLVHGSSRMPLHPLPDGHGLTQAQIRQVQEFIAGNYEHDIGLTELAATLNFSSTYFAHQFKRSFGMPPHQYLMKVRVEQAKRLLEQGGMTVGDIAAQVGFYDQSHLAHHFKRVYGVAPKALLNGKVTT